MKICAIGNSHLAAIKSGWDTISSAYPDVTMTFFGAKSVLLQNLMVHKGTLAPATDELRDLLMLTSRGLDHIAADYDRYLIVGCEVSLRTLVHAVQAGGRTGLETLDARAELARTHAIKLVQQIRQITKAPIGIMPAPYHAGVDATDGYDWGRGARAIASLNELYIATLQDLGREHGFEFFPQPQETLRRAAFLTQEKFCLGGERYSRTVKTRGDGMHMNAEYGAIYLRHVLE